MLARCNAGARRQPIRCNDTSALKHDALRRFCGDWFLGAGLKAAIVAQIEATFARRTYSQSCLSLTLVMRDITITVSEPI